MELQNLMEHEVKYALEHVLNTGIKINCQCEKCKLDIIAICLNSLPPKYIVTKKGLLYSKLNILNQQFNTDILTSLTKAIDKVSKNPRHK
jgi:competence protein ComFB